MANKIHIFKNNDKDPIKEQHDLKNLGNHVRGSRICLVGPPNSGKSNVLKNLIVNQEPAFDQIYIFHIDSSTKEYECLNANLVTSTEDLPILEELEPQKKILVIFEDVDFSSMKKIDVILLDKYLRFGCSHKGLTCYISTQNFFTIPTSLRRKIDIFYVFQVDNATRQLYLRYLPFSKAVVEELLNKYLGKQYDCICLDNSGHPIKLRHNIFTEIKL